VDKQDEFDEFLKLIGNLSLPEQRELLLRYFNGLLAGMDELSITAMRAHFLAKFVPGPEQDMFIEIIDGHLALRSLKKD
jgi:hypothetical protein